MGTNVKHYEDITYREDLDKDNGWRYTFFTNSNSKRALQVWNPASHGDLLIHADDINK